jgi:hypothetical protein
MGKTLTLKSQGVVVCVFLFSGDIREKGGERGKVRHSRGALEA